VPGLGVRITPNDRKTFVLSYRVSGTKKLMALGDYGTLTLDQARQRAIREKAKVIDGQDPLETRQDVDVPASIPEGDRSALLCFRFGGGLERFIGFRDEQTFEVVWIDHDGQAYDHGS
jgi:hypothetical protein